MENIPEIELAQEILAGLEAGRVEAAIEALKNLQASLYAGIPAKQRQSRGVTWVAEQISDLLAQECPQPEWFFAAARVLFDHLAKDDLLLGVPLFMLGEYGQSHPEAVFSDFTQAAVAPAWVVREFAQGAFRRVIGPNRMVVHPWLMQNAADARPELRRFVAETLRPVTTNQWLYADPEYLLSVLRRMYREPHPYPRTSVGNNLSDLSRRQPELIFAVVAELIGLGDRNSAWIAYRACRNLVKKDPTRVMDLLGVDAYHYKNRNYSRQLPVRVRGAAAFQNEMEVNLSEADYAQKASVYLDYLCNRLGARRVGTAANRAATAYVAGVLASFGMRVECPEFDCLDWTDDGADLVVGGEAFPAQVSPYSLGCDVEGPLIAAGSLAELQALDAAGKVLLLHGELAGEQLMPKNFIFYNPDEHQEIYRLLEAAAPSALIAATGRNPELAGALYPFPLIEDGDFDLPSVYLTHVQGERLLQLLGERASLVIRAARRPATGCNVVARRGADPARRVVLTAHIDSKPDTPGALDNASGVATLLLLAEMLAEQPAGVQVEIVALNGEDHYSAAGEMRYLADNQGKFGEILLNVNLDAVGYVDGPVAYSFYSCPPDLEQTVRGTLASRPGLVEGESWFQSDHPLFVMNGAPAVALTSTAFGNILMEIAHTPRDTTTLVDAGKLVETARALHELLIAL
jgi:aminopeptidase YwaD